MAGRIAEMVEEEAARAEAEPDEDEEASEADAPEPAPEPEPDAPEPGAEPIDSAKLQAAVERAHTSYEKALGKIDGLSFEHWEECLKCNSMGYVPPGSQLADNYMVAPDREQCPECAGKGLVISGADNPEHALEQCNKCNGNGWVIKSRDLTPATAQVHYPGQPAPAGNGAAVTMTTPPTGIPDDAWGRPYGHPHYGLAPASIGVSGG